MIDSRNARPKCFSGILSRLLCRDSLPTHPSDHIAESNTTKFIDHRKKDPNTESKIEVSSAAPGIVARLMGLETLPDLDWVPKARNSDSLARSRSVNSMDYLIEFNPPVAHHRRVKTLVSFGEVPTVLSPQNQEYFVFYLGNVDETKELGTKLRKSVMGFEEMNQKKAERSENNKEKNRANVLVKKNGNAGDKKKSSKGKYNCHEVHRKPRAMSNAKTPWKAINQKVVPGVGLKFTEKKNKIRPTVKKTESKHGSKKSSPVSVLDVQKSLIHHESPLSGHSTAVDLNSRKKSSPKTTNFPHITRVSNGDGSKLEAIKNKDKKTLKINGEKYYEKLLGEIGRLTEADMKEAYWVDREVFRFEVVEEFYVEIGQQILDQMLIKLVYDLSGYYM